MERVLNMIMSEFETIALAVFLIWLSVLITSIGLELYWRYRQRKGK